VLHACQISQAVSCAHLTARCLQVKAGVEYAHVIMNVLIDQGGIERVGLAENTGVGEEILYNHSLWRNLGKVFCNDKDGPVEMLNRGATQSIFGWPTNKRLPEPLLTMVCFCLSSRARCVTSNLAPASSA
jgi:hypothetical protein